MLNLVFAGTPEIAANIFADLCKSQQFNILACLTQPDRPTGRGQKMQSSPVKQYALAQHIRVEQPNTLKDAAGLQLLQQLNPDVVVVVAYGLLIPEQLLIVPKFGWLNVHVSLLPRWRGASPIQHAILHGDPITGVSIMQMDLTLDTGAILAQATTEISADDTSYTLQNKLAYSGSQLLQQELAKLVLGTVTHTPQDHHLACYAGKITKAMARINWQESALVIARKIRAFNPAPIAFTGCGEVIIRIWEAQLTLDSSSNTVIPGTIIAATKQAITVATGAGTLNLTVVQLPGKTAVKVADLLNSKTQPLQVGVLLQ